MQHSSVKLNDLPDKILMITLKKLLNEEVIYSLMGINKRLTTILHDPVFTSHLILMRCFLGDCIYPLSKPMLD